MCCLVLLLLLLLLSAYADEMYLAWKDNPESVHKSWDAYFKTGQYTAPPGLYEQYKPLQRESAQSGGQQRQPSAGGGAQGESVKSSTHAPAPVTCIHSAI